MKEKKDKPPKKSAPAKSKPAAKKAAAGKKACRACRVEWPWLQTSHTAVPFQLGRNELQALFKVLAGCGRAQITLESLQNACRRLGIEDVGADEATDMLALFGSTDRPLLTADEFEDLCTEHIKVS